MGYVLKIEYDNNLRRVILEKNELESGAFIFAHLENQIRELFQPPATAPLAITYTDVENDDVTMADDKDLKDALIKQSLNPLRIHVTLSKLKDDEVVETEKAEEANHPATKRYLRELLNELRESRKSRNDLGNDLSELRELRNELRNDLREWRNDLLEAIRREVGDKSEETMAMSSVSRTVATRILEIVGIKLVDGSADDSLEDISVPSDRYFDMAKYPNEETCYEDFFEFMAKYLEEVERVAVRTVAPFPRETDRGYCCRLLDVHKERQIMQLEVELDKKLKIVGSVDGVIVPRRTSILQFTESMLVGIEVKHTPHKETYKLGAPSVSRPGDSEGTIHGQALIEALGLYAHSRFGRHIFLLTSFDKNILMELKDGEIICFTGLNFAQAMRRIGVFLKSTEVQDFLRDCDAPVSSRREHPVSDMKTSVQKRLKIGGDNLFLEQVETLRSFAGSREEFMSDMAELIETWRPSGVLDLTYFS